LPKTWSRPALAERCEVQLAYAMAWQNPVSIMVDTFHTGVVENANIIKAIR
jgi:S-adenosylmethionine synthetase